MIKICKTKSIKAREISDSNGKPTLEVELETSLGLFFASAPSGVSTGKYEALELRDEDGKGVSRAIENIEKIIAPALGEEDLSDQKKIDEILIKLDGTKNKSHLGANAILAVSVAVCRAGAGIRKLPLYRHISQLSELTENGSLLKLPKPSFNMIEGGKHGAGVLAFQEFMVLLQKESFSENLKIGKDIYRVLFNVFEEKFGKENIGLSREGAFCGKISGAKEALELIKRAAEKTGRGSEFKIAIDAAASEFSTDNGYEAENKILSKGGLSDLYSDLMEKYPIVSIEDPFAETDYDAWQAFKSKIQSKKPEILVIGDDLTATNPERMKMAKEKDLCNAMIIKPNQIGTVFETLEAAKLARSYGWKIMVSNRAGETKDDFIADLAVGIGAEFIKSGAPNPAERMAKYDRLVKIEEEAGDFAA